MNLTPTIFEVIDMRSFSNLWFWIALAVAWSSASHYVIGIPFDMLQRARKHGGQALVDFEDCVRINVNRVLLIATQAGHWLLGFVAFVLTGLAVLGFWYEVEFAQAVFLLALPMSIVGALSIATARKIYDEEPTGEALYRRLVRHRLITQTIGMISIFVTAVYGMYQNLVVVPGF